MLTIFHICFAALKNVLSKEVFYQKLQSRKCLLRQLICSQSFLDRIELCKSFIANFEKKTYLRLNSIWNAFASFSPLNHSIKIKFTVYFRATVKPLHNNFKTEKFLKKGNYSICARSVPIQILQFCNFRKF